MVLQGINITKVYGEKVRETKAVDNLNINVNEGEFIGIMGSSGSGKTTLLNILSGIDKTTSGTIKILDVKIDSLNKKKLAEFRRNNVGFVFQDFNLLDSLTIKENIVLPMVLNYKNVEEIEGTALEYMELFNIIEIEDKYPYNVSGGQQQRAAIARALVNNPSIVFADEPTGNLDSKSANDIMKCFEKINQERKATILMVTHDPFAASFCKKVIYIKDGTIIKEIKREGERKKFLNNILDYIACIGGEADEL